MSEAKTTEIHLEDESMNNPQHDENTNEQPSKSSSSSSSRREKTSRTLFVGNIPAETSEDEVRKVFEEYGNIIRVAMGAMDMKKKQNGYAYCFVEFEILRDAEIAYDKLQGAKIGDRNIKLDYDFGPRGQRKSSYRRRSPRRYERRSPRYSRYDDRRDDRYDRRDDRRDDRRSYDDYSDREDRRYDDDYDRDDRRDRRDDRRDNGRDRRPRHSSRRYEPYGRNSNSPRR
ncbi:hypothetical protein C9374_009630 [Naegleria lovaniensis]|uniref:RRM domain-containing protein n=1 Tax=Naegleria lovaniensis TaxID=51637 RepID=A0AA88KPD6_NAELO|nr:uncharacterized protein C9374_009630 [Naegleria lovaniensis]KAG2393053.1 hypothetical protein C9374_009630 [Naegleria lovaniensis]